MTSHSMFGRAQTMDAEAARETLSVRSCYTRCNRSELSSMHRPPNRCQLIVAIDGKLRRARVRCGSCVTSAV